MTTQVKKKPGCRCLLKWWPVVLTILSVPWCTVAMGSPWLQQAVTLFTVEDLHGSATDKNRPAPLTKAAVNRWMQLRDPWAAVLSPEEYKAILGARSTGYGGVEMTLQRLADGTFLCHPRSGGAALRAGIRERDVLLAVDGRPLTQELLQLAGMAIRGPAGTTVRLTVQRQKEAPRTIRVQRVQTGSTSVTLEQLAGHTVCRIHSFTANTAQELFTLLQYQPGNRPVVLDLRGNPGGSLGSAITSAGLFLPQGSEIVTIKIGRADAARAIRRINRKSQRFTFPLLLVQDRHTASAAEVFVAALVQNRRAISLGETSYGKGESQKFLDLADGAALKLSYARLLPPNHRSWHGSGLIPSIPMATMEREAVRRRIEQVIAGTTPHNSY